jgi:hypothetical protein
VEIKQDNSKWVTQADSKAAPSVNAPTKIYADLGRYLEEKYIYCELLFQESGSLTICNHNDRAMTSEKGLIIIGAMQQCRLLKIENGVFSNLEIPHSHIFAIELGRGSKGRAEKICDRFQSEGIIVKIYPEKAYYNDLGRKTVPLIYLR